ncbi:hypothetical protein [Mycobacteroides abscessus]|uniref:hypothetical protein n=1 Tax=Mycobacteroides abscessus TaxID=36809 RepID=UPI000385C3AB|nr:hypothetical protein [Mycobacteroides abscessus]EPZ18401.1 hypothetical protein M879_21525 [Mycobacteroides abscessus V06705]MBN7548425.1 hypothetical protein [Mycobacteroides abscessus subsp. abscessus]MDM2692253.1 hypothetical protein [Mycobacteroides abscessus]MDM2697065.1 hypothetical protein [Mycobacteroides abscessus]MDM2702211.1 hypothetical protein [Mycobacteroides abscessus]
MAITASDGLRLGRDLPIRGQSCLMMGCALTLCSALLGFAITQARAGLADNSAV